METAIYIAVFAFSVLMAVISVWFKYDYVDLAEKEEEKKEDNKEIKNKKKTAKKKTGDDDESKAEEERDKAAEEKAGQLPKLSEALKKNVTLFIILLLLYPAVAAFCMFMKRSEPTGLGTIAQYVVLWETMCIIALIDVKVKKIPTFLIYIAALVRVLGVILERFVQKWTTHETILFSLVGALVGGGIIAVCKLFSKNGVGMGDIRMFALIGFFLGLYGLVNVMFYAMFMAAITGIILLVSKKAARKTQLAMAPFVFIGLNIFMIFLYI